MHQMARKAAFDLTAARSAEENRAVAAPRKEWRDQFAIAEAAPVTLLVTVQKTFH